MEVIIVEHLDPSSPRMGGIAGWTRNLLGYLAKTGVKTTLLGTGQSEGLPGSNGFRFIPVTRKKKFTGYEYLLRLTFKALFLRVPPSAVIHAQHPEYMLPFVLFHRKNPKIVALQGPILKEMRLKRNKVVRFVYEMIEPFILRHSDIVLTVDEATGRFYQQEYPWLARPRVIPTGIDLGKFRLLDRNGLRCKYGFTPDNKVIAYVGRLEKEKNPDFLIDCFDLLKKTVPRAVIVFIGDGKDREHLEELVRQRGLHGVIFLGALEPDKVPEILNCADALVLCSVYEGSPTVVKEALACGVPVVSVDVGDVSQIIRGRNIGEIVSRDKEEYSRTLAGVLLTEDRETVRTECARAAAEFSFDRIGERTVGLYRELRE